MAITHYLPGQVISFEALQNEEGTHKARTLFKTPHLEVIRLVLPNGKSIPQHKTSGDLIVQGLSGCVQFTIGERVIHLRSGEMFYLAASEPHSVWAMEDSSLLLTLLLTPKKGISHS